MLSKLRKLVVPSWLPYAASLALAVSCYTLWTTNGALKTQLAAVRSELSLVTNLVNVQSTASAQKDDVIRIQSASIDKLAAAAKVNREAYLEAQRAAQVSAAKHQIVAAHLMVLEAPEGELEQCRAARDLLEKELVQ